jgi:hypothetical protein
MEKQQDMIKSRPNLFKREEKTSRRALTNSFQKYGRKRSYHMSENVA